MIRTPSRGANPTRCDVLRGPAAAGLVVACKVVACRAVADEEVPEAVEADWTSPRPHPR